MLRYIITPYYMVVLPYIVYCYEPGKSKQKLAFGASNEGIKSREGRRKKEEDAWWEICLLYPLLPEASAQGTSPFGIA
jgi:hypothetical protein